MKDEIERILDGVCMDESFEDALKQNGFEVEIVNEDEDSSDYSTDLTWYTNFLVEKDGMSFSCSVSGTAQKEISYDRWVGTFAEIIEDYSVKAI